MKLSNKLICLISCFLLVHSCQFQKYEQGEALYEFYCSNCHMNDGSGLGQLIPPVANSDYYLAHYSDLPCLIRQGLKDTIMVNGKIYDQVMEGNKSLTHTEVTNIINYMNHKWYPDLKNPDPLIVKSKIEACE